MIGMMNAGQESEFFRENQRPLEISSDGKPVYDVPLFNTQPRKKYSEHIIALQNFRWKLTFYHISGYSTDG